MAKRKEPEFEPELDRFNRERQERLENADPKEVQRFYDGVRERLATGQANLAKRWAQARAKRRKG